MKLNYLLLIIFTILIIILGIYYTLDRIQMERCYNMPINRYVEEKSCEKYTFEDYIKENKYD